MNIITGLAPKWNETYSISHEQIDFFKKNGFIKIKNVLTPEELQYMNEVITREVERLNTEQKSLQERDTYGKAFLQIMNIWTKSDAVKEIVFNKRLAKIAAELMQVSGTRLYHDQALFKEPGGGHTPWHADQFYWPLETDRTITVWIPLQETPLEMGPLEFAAQSYQLIAGRELMISDESQEKLERNLRINNFPHIVEPFELGEVSFHSGWLFHRAGANKSGEMRKVMTMIYMDKEMKLKKPENENQMNDLNQWCPGAEVGAVINSPLNPVLYSRDED
ncbi:MAG: phytanoyl-CoA dioxygenase family protein [Chitinophagaceae bacterium]|nr:phytanoyl-CoA dioxygenase family protein [Chitinophagaceae bacterium]